MLRPVDPAVGKVGRQLKALRRARRVTIGELAGDTGYSESYLSQVEAGAAVPAMSALASLAASLGADLTAFFPREERPPVRVVRAGDPHKLRVAPNAREEYTVLTGRDSESSFTALVHRIFPGHDVVRHRHVGERFALVLEGSIRLTIGGEPFDLASGDAVHYSSHPEHEMHVTSNGPAEILWLVSPAII